MVEEKFKLNESLVVLNNVSDVPDLSDEEVRGEVQGFYAKRAKSSGSCCGPDVASTLYAEDMLLKMPEKISKQCVASLNNRRFIIMDCGYFVFRCMHRLE